MSPDSTFTQLAILLNLERGPRQRLFLGDESDIEFADALTLRERVIAFCLVEGVTQRRISHDIFRVDEAMISREIKIIKDKIGKFLELRRSDPMAQIPRTDEPAPPLTARQRQYLDAVGDFLNTHGRQPSFRELAQRMGVWDLAARHAYRQLYRRGLVPYCGSRPPKKKTRMRTPHPQELVAIAA